MKSKVNAILCGLLIFSLPIHECLAQGPNQPTNHVCRFPEQTDDVHSNAPAISAVADACGPYAFTGTNIEISVSGSASVITNGIHVKTTVQEESGVFINGSAGVENRWFKWEWEFSDRKIWPK